PVVRARRGMELIDQRVGELERRRALVLERRLPRLEISDLRVGQLEIFVLVDQQLERTLVLQVAEAQRRPHGLLVLLAEHVDRLIGLGPRTASTLGGGEGWQNGQRGEKAESAIHGISSA